LLVKKGESPIKKKELLFKRGGALPKAPPSSHCKKKGGGSIPLKNGREKTPPREEYPNP